MTCRFRICCHIQPFVDNLSWTVNVPAKPEIPDIAKQLASECMFLCEYLSLSSTHTQIESHTDGSTMFPPVRLCIVSATLSLTPTTEAIHASHQTQYQFWLGLTVCCLAYNMSSLHGFSYSETFSGNIHILVNLEVSTVDL